MEKRWDVVGFGVVSVDDLVYVDRYPPYGSKVQVQARQRQGGGLTGTALVAAARLGARAGYCGVLGDDELSRWTLEQFQREGVDCSAVLLQPGARPTQSVVLVELSTAQRTIFFSREGVVARPAEAMDDALIGGTRVLLVDHTNVEGGLAAVAAAHRHGVVVISDIEDERIPGISALIAGVDHLLASAEFGRRVTGQADPAEMVRALARPERACCAITAGERGVWYAERGGPVRWQPALPVQVVDTTGCGDVFHGAYAACIARGEPVEQAMRVAAVAAALKATRLGGRAGIPSRATVEQFLDRLAPARCA
jgi:sulfofructose kinase